MFVVRPVERRDIRGLESLASTDKESVHTMPRGHAAIEGAVERSIASFAAQVDMPGPESYLFVLEGSDGELHGSASITASAGSHGMFLSFRNDVIQQVSRDLDVRHSVHALTLCSDLTGHSQLSGFNLRDPHSDGAQAALLSRARLLFATTEPQRFGDKFFSSLAGVTDRSGRSPFWEALGKIFFQMDFVAAERALGGTRDQTLIVELMPHYPVYVPLLPGEAREVMGQVHVSSELALRLLTEEGFEPDEFIDIFDAGPILQARKSSLRTFSSSVKRSVADAPAPGLGERQTGYLVCTVGKPAFRAIAIQSPELGYGDPMGLDCAAREALGVALGDQILAVQF